MPNHEQIKLLKESILSWNKWRDDNPEIYIDLRSVDLSECYLKGANLRKADFREADLHGTDLSEACLIESNLREANLRMASLIKTNLNGAYLKRANLNEANLSEANLSGADLGATNFGGAILDGTNFFESKLYETIFSNVNLLKASNLNTCLHKGPSTIDFRTLQQCSGLPIPFLRGCGLSDLLIDYLPSLLNQAIQFFSCFISYSSADEEFAQRLHADLQNHGIRCWFAPKDVMGGRILDVQIDEAIRQHEKLLLILSSESMNSEWVKTEIYKARRREENENRHVLFPIRLVDFNTIREWKYIDSDTGRDIAREIRAFFIPDFSNWKTGDKYRQAFERLLNDFRAGTRSRAS
jgi:hypothetical protein